MTLTPEMEPEAPSAPGPSLLPFNPVDLIEVRILPAHFARMMDVSRQTVSQWVKRGIVKLGPDGRLDPKQAARQVLDGTDPARLRARVFRSVADDLAALRERVRVLEAEQERAQAQPALNAAAIRGATINACNDEAARALHRLLDELAGDFHAAVEAWQLGQLPEWLDDLAGRVVYGVEGSADDEPIEGRAAESVAEGPAGGGCLG